MLNAQQRNNETMISSRLLQYSNVTRTLIQLPSIHGDIYVITANEYVNDIHILQLINHKTTYHQSNALVASTAL